MALTVITNQNMASFQSILPQGLLSRKTTIFGYIEDDTACACALVEDLDEQYSLNWIWVAEAYRRKGIGTALLDEACRFALQRGGKWMDIQYPTDRSWSRVLNYMLLQRGFRLQTQLLPQYRLSPTDLREAKFIKNTDGQKEQQSIVPLCNLDAQVLKETLDRFEYRKQYLVSRADFSAADDTCSMVLLKDGIPRGITLIQKADENGIMRLDLLYLDPQYAMSGMALLRQTVQAILQQSDDLQEICFTCVSDRALQIAQYLLGDVGRDDRKLFSGTLELDFYRWREKANV